MSLTYRKECDLNEEQRKCPVCGGTNTGLVCNGFNYGSGNGCFEEWYYLCDDCNFDTDTYSTPEEVLKNLAQEANDWIADEEVE